MKAPPKLRPEWARGYRAGANTANLLANLSAVTNPMEALRTSMEPPNSAEKRKPGARV